MTDFPTSVHNIVINLLYEWLGETRFNRSWDDYISIAQRVPKVDAVHAYINQRLQEFKAAGKPPFDAICYVKMGDKGIWYKPYPSSISRETVRQALQRSGLLELKAA
jgi:hypothetical protein